MAMTNMAIASTATVPTTEEMTAPSLPAKPEMMQQKMLPLEQEMRARNDAAENAAVRVEQEMRARNEVAFIHDEQSLPVYQSGRPSQRRI